MKLKKTGFREKLIFTGILSIIAAASVYLYSCNFLSSEDDLDYMLDLPEKFNEVGKLHNEGLDFVFNKIKHETIQLAKDSDLLKKAVTIDFYTLIEVGTLEFCKSKKALRDDYKLIEQVLNSSTFHLKSGGFTKESKSNLSSKQTDLINQISIILDKTHKNPRLKILKSELDNINTIARIELPENEAEVIFCATSTAFYSYQYWLKNHRKWYFTANYPEIIEKYKDEELNKLQVTNGTLKLKNGNDEDWWKSTWNAVEDWWENTSDAVSDWWEEDGKEIANSDVEGAVNGAMGSLIVSAGVLSVPTTVGCSLASSSGKAITEMWD